MIRLKFKVQGVEQITRRIDRTQKAISRELKSATRDNTELVKDAAKAKTIVARSINVQDGSRYQRLSGRTPIRTRFENQGKTGFVRVAGHTTKVRTRSLQAVYRILGRGGDLVRKKGLYIDPDSWIKGADGRFRGRRRSNYTAATDKNLVLMRFSRHPDLQIWANRPDKGQQILRHSIRIRRDAITALTTKPALLNSATQIRRRYREAVDKGKQ